MIHALTHTLPAISFGFGQIEKTAAVNLPLTVWLDTLYRLDAYTFTLAAAGATVTKISNYEYTVVYPTPGSYTISMTVNNVAKTISLESNILSITIA
ncbi:hypothetical protein AM493_13910 [Flavobacterium akiainvivens]|uniref:PKD domain-containing protein n=1 Tax=Flavobacterium akiainvivens TaxID=1202724 RepID=A0A0M8MC21_9FLAO|nr:hypothetical protein [Flavobacterium akiainvivens]KOS07005.1 hypothetical protein AM493_13910 [Flavobacterium akiainvivens]SFQ59295.1 hypothetical protein SAMN05444144_10995 [Flavobacterium akiainvivens]